MPRPVTAAESTARPPIVVVGVEQEWGARSLETVLGPRGFAVVRAYSGRQTLDLAEVATPDAVIVDSRLPDLDGIDVCRALREESRIGAHVPVIITASGPVPRDFLHDAYAAGAWSVWEQPIDGELLLLRLQNWIAAKRVADATERGSLIDRESGLYTYRGMRRRIDEVMADATRRGTPVSCIAIGPMVLGLHTTAVEAPAPAHLFADVGRLLASHARGSDVVGRVGVSEFAILAPMTEAPGALELVERLHDKVSVMAPLVVDGRHSRLGLRIGLASIGSEGLKLHNGSELLVRASTALRYAQSSRTSRVRTFDEVPATFV